MASDFTCALVKRHEAWRNAVYKDSRGIATIGVGFNLMTPGAAAQITYVGSDYNAVLAGAEELNDDQVQILFNHSLALAEAQAYLALSSACFTQLAPRVQSVVIDMVFNLGLTGFKEFKQLIAALKQYDYAAAAAAMKESSWYYQVGSRAVEDCTLVLACVA